MKTDLSFKLLAAAIVAGVCLAFTDPADATEKGRSDQGRAVTPAAADASLVP